MTIVCLQHHAFCLLSGTSYHLQTKLKPMEHVVGPATVCTVIIMVVVEYVKFSDFGVMVFSCFRSVNGNGEWE